MRVCVCVVCVCVLDILCFFYFSLPRFENSGGLVKCTLVPVYGEHLSIVKDLAPKKNASGKQIYFSVHLNVSYHTYVYQIFMLTFRLQYLENVIGQGESKIKTFD